MQDRTDTTSTRTSTRTGARRVADRPGFGPDDEPQGALRRAAAWWRAICWEFDDREPSIRSLELHQRLRVVAWVALALLLWRLVILLLRVVMDVQPVPEFALQADEDGIRTALLYVVGGVILVPFGLFLVWVLLRWIWNLALDLVQGLMPRLARPLALPIVSVVWLQVLFLLRGGLSMIFWDAYYSARHTLELAAKFSLS